MESKKKGEKTVGDKVRQLRSKMGLTQDQLARQCDIPYTTLTKLESNVITKPSVQTMAKVAAGLGVTYVEWQRECLSEMLRIIPEHGAIFYNHKWRVQGGLLQDRQDIVEGFPVRQILIWRRKGGLNFNPGYFLPTYEVIYVIAKPKFRLAPKANAHGDIWEFTQDMGNPHPAPFPVDLIDRIVSSTPAKNVLDPFMGSGTTAIAAINHKRDYVGIELWQEYCDMAEERIKHETAQAKLL